MSKRGTVAVVIVNWNGEEDSLNCIESLQKQTLPHTIIAVDNGSDDNFSDSVKRFKDVVLLQNEKNLGFTGGVNTALNHVLDRNFKFVALINNDALPEKTWLEALLTQMANNKVGIVTGKLLRTNGTIDSTGDRYTTWGLPYPRGRDEQDSGQYNTVEPVLAASGGASMYRVSMLKEIGMFDNDFFAYYEDVDLSFRAQLAGWEIMYTPGAIAHHKVGESSKKIPGLTTYMTVRNLPWLFWKNVPLRLVPRMWPRFFIAHSSIVFSSLAKGAIVPTLKGVIVSLALFPKKLWQRRNIQKNRKVSNDYITSLIINDLPPNAHKLRKLRGWLL